VIRYVPEWLYIALIGTYMSTAKRDPNQSKSGKAPTFQIRITPQLKAQFEEAAKAEGMSLGNWLKTLGRQELQRKGFEPIND
jgi:predicted HicB family RNase H-like nuclease